MDSYNLPLMYPYCTLNERYFELNSFIVTHHLCIVGEPLAKLFEFGNSSMNYIIEFTSRIPLASVLCTQT